MPRQVYRWDSATQKMIEIHKAPPRARIHVIEDTMPETEHPADGHHYESKSAFRMATKMAGCEEMGNDKVEKKPVEPPPGIEEDLMRACKEHGIW